MSIPDLIFAIGGVILCVSLIPALRGKGTSMPLKTSLPTGIVVVVYGFTFAYMGLWFSTIIQSLAGLCWLFLAAFRRTPSTKTGRVN